MIRSTSSFVSRVSSARYVEHELDLGSDSFMRAVIEGVPLPVDAYRWVALWSIRAATVAVTRGERLVRELARIDAAIDEVDCRIDIEATVAIDDDGQAGDVTDVVISHKRIRGDGPWTREEVEEPCQWLVEYVQQRTNEMSKKP